MVTSYGAVCCLLLPSFFLVCQVLAHDTLARTVRTRCARRCGDEDCLTACQECERACNKLNCQRGLLLCDFPSTAPPYLCNVQYNKSGKCSVPAASAPSPSRMLDVGPNAPTVAPRIPPLQIYSPPVEYWRAPPSNPPVRSGGDDFHASRLSRSPVDIPVLMIIAVLLAVALCIAGCIAKSLMAGFKAIPTESPESDKSDSLGSRSTKSSEVFVLLSQPLHAYTLQELRLATKNFSPSTLLGNGGQGPLYKATLTNKRIVTARKVNYGPNDSMRDFYTDINSVAKMEHRNLTPIRGCCVEEGQRWLVFDYYSNGSLQDAVFGPKSSGLTWLQCREIMLGTARGLAHLHHASNKMMLHSEIHPGNVLLDSNFKAHLADFGFPRPPKGIQDRPGYPYMCPILLLTGRLTDKSDVYSLGMLMLAMISGRKPNPPTSTCLSLAEMASAYISESKLLQFVNSKFQAHYYMSEVVSYMSVAMLCVQQDPVRRPSMLEVVSMLEGSKNMAPPVRRKPGRPPIPRQPLPQQPPRQHSFHSDVSDEPFEHHSLQLY